MNQKYWDLNEKMELYSVFTYGFHAHTAKSRKQSTQKGNCYKNKQGRRVFGSFPCCTVVS